MSLTNSQKLFLQAFMSKGIMDTKEVKRIYGMACMRFGENSEEAHLAQFVIAINQRLKPFGLDIKKGICEETGANCYCLVNFNRTDITLKATDYASHELEFFKKLVDKIVKSDKGCVSSIDAINLSYEVKEKKMRVEDADALLSRLEEDLWLQNVKGMVTLSTRSILELEPYLNNVYERIISKCEMCKKICIKGQSCRHCDTKLHKHCALKYFDKQENPKCPSAVCKKPWVNTGPSSPKKPRKE